MHDAAAGRHRRRVRAQRLPLAKRHILAPRARLATFRRVRSPESPRQKAALAECLTVRPAVPPEPGVKLLHRRPGRTDSVEREHAVQRRRELGLKCPLQALPCSVQSRPDRFRAQLKDSRRLLDAKLLHRSHNEHDPELLGQLIDEPFDEPADLAPGSLPLGIRGPRRQWERIMAPSSAAVALSMTSRETVGRCLRTRPSASFRTIRVSQVESVASPRKSARPANART